MTWTRAPHNAPALKACLRRMANAIDRGGQDAGRKTFIERPMAVVIDAGEQDGSGKSFMERMIAVARSPEPRIAKLRRSR